MVTSRTDYTPEEHFLEEAARFPSYPVGCGVLHDATRGAFRVRFPLAEKGFPRSPKFAARKLETFEQQLLERDAYTTPAIVHQRRQQFLTELLKQIHAIGHPEPPQIMGPPQPPDDPDDQPWFQ